MAPFAVAEMVEPAPSTWMPLLPVVPFPPLPVRIRDAAPVEMISPPVSTSIPTLLAPVPLPPPVPVAVILPVTEVIKPLLSTRIPWLGVAAAPIPGPHCPLMVIVPVPEEVIEEPDPAGPFGAKEVGQGPLLPIMPAICNAVFDAVGVRVDEIPCTPEKILKALQNKAAGKPARYGPDSFPDIKWPETLLVTPPWEGGDGRASNEPERKKRKAEAGVEVKAGITIAREAKTSEPSEGRKQ